MAAKFKLPIPLLVLIAAEFASIAITTEVRLTVPPPLPAAGIAAALLAILITLPLMPAELMLTPALFVLIPAELVLTPAELVLIAAELVAKLELIAEEFASMAKMTEVRLTDPPLPAVEIAAALLAMLITLPLMPAELVLMPAELVLMPAELVLIPAELVLMPALLVLTP